MEFEITGKRIILRSLKATDASSIHRHANDRQVFRYTTLPYPYTIKDARDFIKSTVENLEEQSSYEFGISLKEDDEIVGMIGLKKVNRENKLSAELGYWLGKKYWRQGITREAVGLMLDFAFNDINLHKVYAKVMKPNIASFNLLKKFGFQEEGLMREYEKRNNRWMDVYYMGLLKKEFKK